MADPDFVIPFDRLPENFARSVEHPPKKPTVARPAATIVLMRDGADGPEVLLMRRSRSAGFVPGAYVFPGGRVDMEDADQAIVDRLDGLSDADAADRLDLHDARPPAIAYYLAAVREAFEETGIMVGLASDGTPPSTASADPDVDEVRHAVMDDEVTFADALDRLGARVDGSAIEYIAHWITPEVEPRRYDTRFFAACVSSGAEAIIDPREMTDAIWLTPSEALARRDEGRLPLVFPTIKTLQQLEAYPSVKEALRELGNRAVPAILPRLVVTPTGLGLELEG